MKSERRHELQENQLADWLEDAGQAVAPHVKTIAFVVVAAVVAVIAYSVWQSRAEGDQAAAWNAFYAATSAEKPDEALLAVAEGNSGNAAGMWARLTLADTQLAQGVQNLTISRTVARPKLKDAASNYHVVGESAAGKYPVLVERALFGEAKAREALGEKSDLDAAEKLYAQLTDEFPDSPLAAEARGRIAELKKPAAREFYDWFAKAEPAIPPLSTGGTPGIGPAFNDSNIPTPPTTDSVDPDFDPLNMNGASETQPNGSAAPTPTE